MAITRTARAWGVPVSVLRGDRRPGKKWTGKDTSFALALTAYEADLCGGCGQPMSRTTGDHKHDFEVQTVTCVACDELERFKELTREPEKGEKTFVVRDE